MSARPITKQTNDRERVGCWVALSAGLSLVILLAAILNLSSQARIWEKIPEMQKLVASAFALGSLVLFGSAIAYLASPRRTLGIVHAFCMGAMAIALFIPGWSFWTARPGTGGPFAGVGYAIALAMMFVGISGAVCAVVVFRTALHRPRRT